MDKEENHKVFLHQNSKVFEQDTSIQAKRESEIFLRNVHRGLREQKRDAANDFVAFKQRDYHLLRNLDHEKFIVHDAQVGNIE